MHPVHKIKTPFRQATVYISMRLWRHLESTSIHHVTPPIKKNTNTRQYRSFQRSVSLNLTFSCSGQEQLCSESQSALFRSRMEDSCWLWVFRWKERWNPALNVFTDQLHARVADVHPPLNYLTGLRCKAIVLNNGVFFLLSVSVRGTSYSEASMRVWRRVLPYMWFTVSHFNDANSPS